MAERPDTPFLPDRAPIDAYGNGGFRFGGMSHRGSILCLPGGVHAWPVTSAADLVDRAFAPVIREADDIDLLLVGTGLALVPLGEALRWRLRDRRVVVEPMATGAAARTYNILLGEGRRVAAALIAVD